MGPSAQLVGDVFLDEVPFGSQDHFFDHELAFAFGIVDANGEFVLLDAEVDHVSQRNQLIRRASDDHVHHFVGNQRVFGAGLYGHLRRRAPDCEHESVRSRRAVPHAHSHDCSVLVHARLSDLNTPDGQKQPQDTFPAFCLSGSHHRNTLFESGIAGSDCVWEECEASEIQRHGWEVHK